MPFYMQDCTRILVEEIEELRLSQNDVAITFAAAMRSEAAGADKPDWGKVGQAALKRWGPAGWKKVKDRGWKIFEGKA